MPRLERNPQGVVSLGPQLARLEPARRRADRTLSRTTWSKGLATATGKSGSYTRRQLRGEQPTPREDYDRWLSRLCSAGHVAVARARVAEDAALVGCRLVAMPTAQLSPAFAVAAVIAAAGAFASTALEALEDGELTTGEVEALLERLDEQQRQLDEARAALLARRAELEVRQ